jgi:FtsZ-interacting cell division protein ZipA
MAHVFEITAMWNLNGSDINKAKEELETRRAALKADYEEELKQIEAKLADIETVERVAVNFVSSYKGDKPSPASEAEPEKAAEKEPSSVNGAAEIKDSISAEKPAENSSEQENKPAGEAAPMEQKGSRWRMRLGTLSETEAAD